MTEAEKIALELLILLQQKKHEEALHFCKQHWATIQDFWIAPYSS